MPVFVKFTNDPRQAEEEVNVAETGLVLVILNVFVSIQPLPSVTVTVYPPGPRLPLVDPVAEVAPTKRPLLQE